VNDVDDSSVDNMLCWGIDCKNRDGCRSASCWDRQWRVRCAMQVLLDRYLIRSKHLHVTRSHSASTTTGISSKITCMGTYRRAWDASDTCAVSRHKTINFQARFGHLSACHVPTMPFMRSTGVCRACQICFNLEPLSLSLYIYIYICICPHTHIHPQACCPSR
jgi:hypothetical protein